jgi:TRAP-type C4-dicarboxylate transport system substrate-binding protein
MSPVFQKLFEEVNKMKKNLIISLAVLAVFTLSLTMAYAQQATKPIELISSHTSPAVSGIGKMFKQWGDRIEEKSGGRVKFVYYWAGTLVPIPEQVKGIKTGTADVAQIGPLSIASYMPLSYNIPYLPFMGLPSMTAGTKIWWELYDKFPAMKNEWADVKLLASRMMPPDQIHTTRKMVKAPADVKGMKLAISSALISKVITQQGGAATPIPPTDIAVSLSTNVVEGWINHFPVAMIFGTLPSFRYHLVVGTNDYAGIDAGMDQLIMNKDKWNKLPADIQKIFEEESAWYQEETIKMDMAEIQKAMTMVKDAKHTITYLTPEELKLWADAAAPVHQAWIADNEAKGKPAKAIYEEMKKLIHQYK